MRCESPATSRSSGPDGEDRVSPAPEICACVREVVMPGPKERNGFGPRRLGVKQAGDAHQSPGSADPGWETSMTAAELIALGQSVFGWGWRTHLSRAIGVNRRLIHYWQASERTIPPEIAGEIRKLGDIGPVGTIIRAAVRAVAPDLMPYRC